MKLCFDVLSIYYMGAEPHNRKQRARKKKKKTQSKPVYCILHHIIFSQKSQQCANYLLILYSGQIQGSGLTW